MLKVFITSTVLLFFTLANAQKSGTTAPTKPVSSVAKKPAAKPVNKGKVSFKIIGKMNGFKYHLMVLNKFRHTEYQLLDSVTTDAEGNFTIQKTIDEPCVAFLMHSKTAAVPLIIENGAVFNVDIKSEGNVLDYSISGIKAEKSIRLYDFVKIQSKIYSELSEIEQKLYKEQDAMKMQELQFQFANKQKEMKFGIENELVASGLEGYFVLYNFMEEQSTTDVKKVMDKMTPLELKTIYYRDLKKFYDDNKLLEIGEMAPNFSLPTPNGDTLKLSDLRGKVVLIDFWASWCGPCRAEFPNVIRVYNKYGEKGFEILGVSLDDQASAWKGSIISLGLNWKHVSDLKKWNCAPARLYKVSSIPATILVGKDGKIIAKNLRGEELERKLEELFQ